MQYISVTGLLHFDFITLCCGIIYWLLIPSCFIFLQIYSIANLNDVSWGTRSGGGGGSKRKIRRKKKAVGFVAKIKEFVFGPEYIEEVITANDDGHNNIYGDNEEENAAGPPEPTLDYEQVYNYR